MIFRKSHVIKRALLQLQKCEFGKKNGDLESSTNFIRSNGMNSRQNCFFDTFKCFELRLSLQPAASKFGSDREGVAFSRGIR